MIIAGRRIRNLERRIGPIAEGQAIVLGLVDLERFTDRLARIGLSLDAEDGTTALPAPVGPVSRYNAEGKWQIHRDRPKETAYRQVEWHWYEFRGRDKVEMSDVKDVPYQRYPRTLMPPPGVELTLMTDARGNRMVVTPSLPYVQENHQRILHTINLFLELFRECSVMDTALQEINFPAVTRVNWRLLPPGRIPWDRLRGELEPLVSRQRRGNQPVVWRRLHDINGHQPGFVAVGEAGFSGYLAFGFPDRNLYVLESIFTGNATYVFEEDWETLSRMTKGEILREDLQKDRLIHVEGWRGRLDALFADGS